MIRFLNIKRKYRRFYVMTTIRRLQGDKEVIERNWIEIEEIEVILDLR
jgi:hypothetical protein